MPTLYPPDKSEYMRADGPKDKRFVVDHGSLVYCKRRDARFPYLYEVSSHPLVHNTEAVKRILVYIIDTDPAALKTLADWEETLGIPVYFNKYAFLHLILLITFDRVHISQKARCYIHQLIESFPVIYNMSRNTKKNLDSDIVDTYLF